MCGIAGLVEIGARDAALRARQVIGMRDALGHRGPDDRGIAEIHGTQVTRHGGSGDVTRT